MTKLNPSQRRYVTDKTFKDGDRLDIPAVALVDGEGDQAGTTTNPLATSTITGTSDSEKLDEIVRLLGVLCMYAAEFHGTPIDPEDVES